MRASVFQIRGANPFLPCVFTPGNDLIGAAEVYKPPQHPSEGAPLAAPRSKKEVNPLAPLSTRGGFVRNDEELTILVISVDIKQNSQTVAIVPTDGNKIVFP